MPDSEVLAVLPLAHAVAHQIIRRAGRLTPCQKEDILADLTLVIFESAKNHDPAQGSLGGYVRQVARFRTWNLVYAHRYGTTWTKAEWAARAGIAVMSTDAPLMENQTVTFLDTLVDPQGGDGFAAITERDYTEHLETLLRGLLSPLQFEIVWLRHVQMLSYAAISERTGRDYKSIDNALQNACQCLRRAFLPGTLQPGAKPKTMRRKFKEATYA